MISSACAWCHVPIKIKEYRFKGHKAHCCSVGCSGKYRIKRGLGPPSVSNSDMLSKIQFWYEQRDKTIVEIAFEFKYSRSLILLLARKHGWIKFQRTPHIRTTYRKAAEKKIGRKLIRGEHVHHKDGLITNNEPTNLHVFPNAKKHTESHGSLERVAFELYRQGVIGFDDQSGTYFLIKQGSANG